MFMNFKSVFEKSCTSWHERTVVTDSKPLDIFIGLGAAKSGTTWLHDYLFSHPQAHLRRFKEIYHFGRDTPGVDGAVRARNNNVTADAIKGLRTRGLDQLNYSLLCDMQEWHTYLGGPNPAQCDQLYPHYLRTRGELKPEARICGDITPQYAMMSEAEYKRMNASVPDAKYIFLVREPVARWWSNCNHLKRHDIVRERQAGDKPVPHSWAKKSTQEIAEAYIAGDPSVVNRIAGQSDYKGTLRKILSLIERDRLYIGFYEELASEKQTREICEFLGIDFHPANRDRHVNVGDKDEIPDTLYRAAVELFRGEYTAVANASTTSLPDAWTTTYA